ncbi:uncharacterized protein LOC134726877 [Mytilus trossulus]|uniref:uncharacterized protein LOC134726877 n=1 Tax=Mytilus trossulus TaxID=6551 RepID=UPI0030049D40
MALSKSVIKAQDIISCNLCESETKLKWKCLDCDLLMCNKCNDKIHPKFKNAKDHTIVDIKQVGISGGDNKILDLTSIKCTEHTTQSCCLFCCTCDALVCPICIAKMHTGHTFIEIKEAYDMKLELLETFKLKVESAKKELADDERRLEQLKIAENFKGKNVLQDIEARKEAYIKYADQLSKDVKHKIKINEDSISKKLTTVTDSRHKLQEVFSIVDKIINSSDSLKILENIDKIEKSLETAIQPINIHHSYLIPQFMPGENIPSTFGSLTEVSSGGGTGKIEMKVNKQFTTDLKRCHYLWLCSNGSIVLGDSINKSLQKVQTDGNSLATIFTIKTSIRGIVVTSDGDILLADATPRLKRINGANGKIQDSQYSVDPLEIMSLHVSKDRKIIVGAMSVGAVIPVTGRRVVIVMDKDGKHEFVYEYDNNKKRLMTYPRNITSTISGKIFVADFAYADRRNSRILALNKDGNILNTYKGNPNINNVDKPFQPESMQSTPLDSVVISDLNNQSIHILDNSCNLIYYKETRDIGIMSPSCVAFTSATLFYLGCSPPASSTNGKLYEIEYSGF